MFRSLSDRQQMDIRAEQIFAKDKSRFIEVYIASLGYCKALWVYHGGLSPPDPF